MGSGLVWVGSGSKGVGAVTSIRRERIPLWYFLNLALGAAIDYAAFNKMNDRTAWLAYCGVCPVPEIANVFSREGISLHQITGMLKNDLEWRNEGNACLDLHMVGNGISLLQKFVPPSCQLGADEFDASSSLDGIRFNSVGVLIPQPIFGEFTQ